MCSVVSDRYINRLSLTKHFSKVSFLNEINRTTNQSQLFCERKLLAFFSFIYDIFKLISFSSFISSSHGASLSRICLFYFLSSFSYFFWYDNLELYEPSR